MQTKNRFGAVESAQISNMGNITLTSNFKLNGIPFNIKNNNDDAVTLEVRLADMDPDTFVSTTFEHGWNPEIILEIKANSSVSNLQWGA